MATDPQMFIRIAASVEDLKTAMAQAREAVTQAGESAKAAGGAFEGFGHSWVARIAEGQLLRDAVREALNVMKEMAAFLPEIAMKGSVVGDVEKNFESLTEQSGQLSAVLLGALRAGTHGTIDDFELMQRSNKDLAAGLTLTTAQSALLAQGAFALAKATGGDAKTALDSMSDAMVTGRTKAIALLTGKIDLKAAEEAFALSLGGTSKELTAEGKLEADREAILKAVQAGLTRVGEQTDSLADKVQQARVNWSNFEDELGKQIAQSPVLAAGFDTLRKSLIAAFGGDQKTLIANITSAVNSAAIVVVDFGLGAVEGARVVHVAFSLVKEIVLGVEEGLVIMAAAALEAFAATAKGATYLPGATKQTLDLAASSRQAADDMWALKGGLDEETKAAALGITGNSEFDKTLDKLGGVLFTTRDAMLAASAATLASVEPLKAEASASDAAAAATAKHAAYLHQTAAEAAALAKLEAETALLTAKVWAQYYKDEGDLYATDVQKARNAAEAKYEVAVAEAQNKGITDVAYYNALWALRQLDASKNTVDTAALTKNSIEGLQAVYDKAQATFEAMMHDGLHHSQTQVQYFRDIRDKALEALRDVSGASTGIVVSVAQQIAAQIAAITKQIGGSVMTMGNQTVSAFATMSDAEQAVTDGLNAQNVVVQQLDGSYLKLADSMAKALQGNTIDLATAAQDPVINQLLHQGWSLKNAEQIKLAKDWGFTPKLFDPLGNPENAPSPGEHVPGYKDGGPTVPGLSMLHGGEYVVPKEGALVSAGGGVVVTIHNYITQPLGTPDAIAKVVGPAIIASLRNTGQRLPLGN